MFQEFAKKLRANKAKVAENTDANQIIIKSTRWDTTNLDQDGMPTKLADFYEGIQTSTLQAAKEQLEEQLTDVNYLLDILSKYPPAQEVMNVPDNP